MQKKSTKKCNLLPSKESTNKKKAKKTNAKQSLLRVHQNTHTHLPLAHLSLPSPHITVTVLPLFFVFSLFFLHTWCESCSGTCRSPALVFFFVSCPVIPSHAALSSIVLTFSPFGFGIPKAGIEPPQKNENTTGFEAPQMMIVRKNCHLLKKKQRAEKGKKNKQQEYKKKARQKKKARTACKPNKHDNTT